MAKKYAYTLDKVRECLPLSAANNYSFREIHKRPINITCYNHICFFFHFKL